jgi:hypothetical protein
MVNAFLNLGVLGLGIAAGKFAGADRGKAAIAASVGS